MENKNQTGLDQVFRDRLKNDPNSQYASSNWDHFEKQLDKALPVQRKRRPFFFWFAIAGVIGIGSLYFTYSTKNSIAKYNPIDSKLVAYSKNHNETARNIPASSNVSKTIVLETTKEETNLPTKQAQVKNNHLKNEQSTLRNQKEKTQQAVEKEEVKDVVNIETNFTLPEETKIEALRKPLKESLEEIPAEDQDQALVISENEESSVAADTTNDKPLQNLASLPIIDAQAEPEAEVIQPKDQPITPPLSRRIYLVAGINYGKGFSNTEETTKEALDPFFGLGYYHPVTHWLGFSIEGHYLAKTGHHLRQENEIVRFFLDRNIERNTIETQTIQYFQFPLSTSWQILPKHRLNTGILFTTVLDTKSNRSQTTTVKRTNQVF